MNESRLAIVVDSRDAKTDTESLATAMQALEDAGLRVTETAAKSGRSAREAGQSYNQAGRQATTGAQGVDRINKSLNTTETSATQAALAIRRAFIGGIAGISAMNVIDQADNWGQYASRIRMATESAEEYELVQARMLQSANATYRNIDETRESFIQLSPVLRQMGMDLGQSLDAIDAFSGLLVVNAANADRAQAAQRALSVALQKGKLDADGWITIYSTLDSLVDVLAEHSGKSAEEIRKLGASGQLSVDMIAQALAGGYGEIMRQVEGMPTTVRDAMQNVRNAFGEYIGTANEANGVTAGMASAINLLGENLDSVLNVAVLTGSGLLAAYTARTIAAGLATGQLTVAKIAEAAATRNSVAASHAFAVAKVAEAQAAVASATGMARLTAVQTALIPAQQRLAATTTAMAAANRAFGMSLLGLVGGPIGALTLGIGVAATAFLTLRSGADEADTAIEDLADSTNRLTKAQLENARFKAADALAKREQEAKDAAIALQGVQRDYDALKAAFEEGRGVTEEGLKNVNRALVEQQAELDTANQKLDAARKHSADLAAAMDRLAGSAGEAGKALGDVLSPEQYAKVESEWLGRYATNAEKLAAELAKAREEFKGFIPPDVEKRIRDAFTPKGGGSAATELQNLVKQLNEQKAVLGMTEAQAERYRIESAKGAEQDRQRALATFDYIQQEKDRAEAIRQAAESASYLAAVQRELDLLAEDQDISIRGMGMGERYRSELEAEMSMRRDYAERRRELEEDQQAESTRISETQYQARLSALRSAEEASIQILRDAAARKLEAENDWRLGAIEGLRNYADESRDAYSSMAQSVRGGFDAAGDALIDWAFTADKSFGDTAKSYARMVASMMIKQQVLGPLAGMAASALGSMFTPSGVGAATAADVRAAGDGLMFLDRGGYTGDGGRFEPAGIVHKGEGVLNQDEIRALGGEEGFNALRKAIRTGHADGGMAGMPIAASRLALQAAPAAGGDIHIEVNVSESGASMATTGDRSNQFGQELAIAIRQTVQTEIARSHRQGGMAWQQRNGRM